MKLKETNILNLINCDLFGKLSKLLMLMETFSCEIASIIVDNGQRCSANRQGSIQRENGVLYDVLFLVHQPIPSYPISQIYTYFSKSEVLLKEKKYDGTVS